MNIKNFTNPNGKFVRFGEGYSFIPSPLPPRLEYDEDIVDSLSRANFALGRLNGMGKILKNPYLLVTPLLRQEAISSSAIEETYSTMEQLYIFEMDESTKPDRSQTKEVFNYVRAMEYGFSTRRRIPFSLRLVKRLHEILMRDVRGESKDPGRFRRVMVAIGDKSQRIDDAVLIPPPPTEMKTALDQWEKFCHAEKRIPPLIKCALLHYQFEVIHPFRDGNGRVGRMLISVCLHDVDYLDYPLLFISRYFERNRQQYYRSLQKVSEKSDWKGWILFFLDAVADQSERNLNTGMKIIDLQEKYRSRLEKSNVPGRLYTILDELFVFPYTTVKRVQTSTKKTYQTARNDILKLVDLGILQEVPWTGKKKIYRMGELLRLLESR